MKKSALLLPMIVLAVCLFVGCNNSDMTALEDKYSEVTALYNEVAALVNDNGWLADETVTTDMTAISTSLQQVKSVIDNPDTLGDADPEELADALENFKPILEQYKEICAKPYTSG